MHTRSRRTTARWTMGNLTPDEARQSVALQTGTGEPTAVARVGDSDGKWVRVPTTPTPQAPFQHALVVPASIAPMGSLECNGAIPAKGNKQSAAINVMVSPLSGKNVRKQPEVVRLRDR